MKFNYLISFFCVLFIFGCSKDLNESNNDVKSTQNDFFARTFQPVNLVRYNIQEIDVVHHEPWVASLSGVAEMLEFTSYQHFKQTLDSLEASVEAHEDSLLVTYGHLDDDDLHDMEELIGFDDDLPLKDFESNLNFDNSMRKAFRFVENEWLENDLSYTIDPHENFPYSIYEMTLLNDQGEVKIGDDIIKFTNGEYVVIANANLQELTEQREAASSFVENQIEMRSDDCRSFASKTDYDPYATDREVRFRVRFSSYPWKWRGSGTIWSYKKNRRHKWKPYKMHLNVATQVYFFGSNCSGGDPRFDQKGKRKKSLTVGPAFWGAFMQKRAKNGESVGVIFSYANTSKSMVLTW